MPVPRKRVRMVLCAVLTADGKLDEGQGDLPDSLLRDERRGGRHPWAVPFDRADAMIVDEPLATALALTRAATRPLLVVASEETLDFELERLRSARPGGWAWCFGGAGLFRALLDRAQVDELCLCVRPRIDGRRGAATLSGPGGGFFPASVACRLVRMEVRGGECFLHYRVRRNGRTARKAA